MSKISSLKEWVDEHVEEAIKDLPEEMIDPIREYVNRGGKRVRPVLLLLASESAGRDRKEFEDVALAIEVFHNFTLVHDDIEDASLYRRGKPTLHILYGEPVAINLGDAMYTVVWRQLINSSLSKGELNEIERTFMGVVKGQHLELSAIHEERFDLAYEEYYEITKNKTGVLLALSTALPFYNVDKEKYAKIYNAMTMLGVAFQIQDDLLNITGDFEKYKKKIGDDITEGKRTLMVLYALKNLPEEKAKALKAILKKHTEKEEEIREAIELIKESGAIDFAKKEASTLIEKYLPALKEELPQNDAAESILEVVHMFINREA